MTLTLCVYVCVNTDLYLFEFILKNSKAIQMPVIKLYIYALLKV